MKLKRTAIKAALITMIAAFILLSGIGFAKVDKDDFIVDVNNSTEEPKNKKQPHLR